ncbi:hypothetical protein [Escherichia coli]|nr:hypothetical protein [Escherichia coli]
MFALADINSFYASCEKVFRPDLRNRVGSLAAAACHGLKLPL